MKNIIEKQKGWLLAIAIALIVLGALAIAGGITLIFMGTVHSSLAIKLIEIIGGSLLILLGLGGIVYGIIMLFTGIALKATKETIKEENLAKKPNEVICPKCGFSNKENTEVCTHCGEKLN